MRLFLLVFVLLASETARAQSVPLHAVLGAGGGTTSSGNYTIVGTLGQVSAGKMSSPSHGADVGYYVPGEFIPTDSEDAVETLPTAYHLAQNYPNPFNPTTTIQFDLPETAHVSLTVLDPAGRKVLTVADRTFKAGVHKILLNTRGLSSGVYFYRLQTPRYAQSRRLVIMK